MDALLAGLGLMVCLVPGVLLRYLPFRSRLSPRTKKQLVFGYLLVFLLGAGLMTYRFLLHGISMRFVRSDGVLVTFALAAVNLIVIRKMLREQMFIFGIIIVCNYLLISVPEYVATHIPGLSSVQEYWMYILMYYCLLAASFFPLRKMVKHSVEPFFHLDAQKYWSTIWFIPVALFIVLFIAIPFNDTEYDLVALAGRVLLVVVDILLCLSITKDHQSLYEKLIMTEQLSKQKLHYAQLQSRVEEARRHKHDMKHMLSAIRHYIASDDKSGLSEYCDQLAERNQLNRVNLPYTGNVAVDGIIYEYMHLCQAHQVEFSYMGTIQSKGISDIDICVILGNSLDNALAGCQTIAENRYIHLRCKSESHILTVVITNSFDGNIQQDSRGNILSRKREQAPGIGLSSIDEICQRCGGTVQRSWDDSCFTTVFMLPTENA